MTVGILYGAYHQQRLAKREVKIRDIETAQKKVRDEKLAVEKKIAADGNFSLVEFQGI